MRRRVITCCGLCEMVAASLRVQLLFAVGCTARLHPPCKVGSFEWMGTCLCKPGYAIGQRMKRCVQQRAQKSCNSTSDACYYNPAYGVAFIDHTRWQLAQSGETRLWAGKGAEVTDDHADWNANMMNKFKALLQRELGDVAEIGCGPFTQLRHMLIHHLASRRSTVRSVTLVEPSAEKYRKEVAGCPYKTGHLTLSNTKGVDTLQTTILPVGGEELNAPNAFDTIVMLNVLEHTFDALRVLSNIHRALRPGGVLVFMDTVYSDYEGTEYAEWLREMARTRKQPLYWNWQLHPIRLRPTIIEEFIDLGFNKSALFGPQWFKGRRLLHKEVVAFIATKK